MKFSDPEVEKRFLTVYETFIEGGFAWTPSLKEALQWPAVSETEYDWRVSGQLPWTCCKEQQDNCGSPWLSVWARKETWRSCCNWVKNKKCSFSCEKDYWRILFRVSVIYWWAYSIIQNLLLWIWSLSEQSSYWLKAILKILDNQEWKTFETGSK